MLRPKRAPARPIAGWSRSLYVPSTLRPTRCAGVRSGTGGGSTTWHHGRGVVEVALPQDRADPDQVGQPEGQRQLVPPETVVDQLRDRVVHLPERRGAVPGAGHRRLRRAARGRLARVSVGRDAGLGHPGVTWWRRVARSRCSSVLLDGGPGVRAVAVDDAAGCRNRGKGFSRAAPATRGWAAGDAGIEVVDTGGGRADSPVVPEADLVLEGGGVKGLGTAGAVMGLLEAGWTFPRVAGTSVGAARRVLRGRGCRRRRSSASPRPARPAADPRPPGPPAAGQRERLPGARATGAYAGDWIHRWLHRRAGPSSASAPSPTCAATIPATTPRC